MADSYVFTDSPGNYGGQGNVYTPSSYTNPQIGRAQYVHLGSSNPYGLIDPNNRPTPAMLAEANALKMQPAQPIQAARPMQPGVPVAQAPRQQLAAPIVSTSYTQRPGAGNLFTSGYVPSDTRTSSFRPYQGGGITNIGGVRM